MHTTQTVILGETSVNRLIDALKAHRHDDDDGLNDHLIDILTNHQSVKVTYFLEDNVRGSSEYA